MIASFTHGFIFLKTRKVGGTSLEIVLSSWCRGDDICTPVTAEDERIRETYGGRARNFSAPDGSPLFYNHMPAVEVRAALPDLWDRAFKFSVERHPYEKVVSRAWWQISRRGGDPERELAAEIEATIENRSYLNYPLYTANGKVLANEVWPYSKMWDRVGELATRLGLPQPAELPRAKAGHRQDQRPARDVLSRRQRERIQSDARIEFELLRFRP